MYHELSTKQKQILDKLTKQKSFLSWTRLLLLLASIYFFYQMLYQRNEHLGIYAFVLLIAFIIVVNFYLKLNTKVAYHKALKKINDDEIAFLEGKYVFENGSEFQNPQHAFSYDLDLFGSNSIFQFINRSGTSLGKQRFANDLQEIPTKELIEQKQKAIQELKDKIDFRQHFQTLAHLAGTSEKEDLAIKNWSETKTEKPSALLEITAILIPVLFVISCIGFFFDLHPVFPKLAGFFFTLNLALVGFLSQSILKEIGKGDKIANSIQQYAKMIHVFETTHFQSNYLNELQSQLKKDQKSAHLVLDELANCFEKLNTIANFFIFIAFNGTFQYHFWVYKRLLKWKQNHQQHLWNWIEMIGKIEALNSLANFAYNNAEYEYPEISEQTNSYFEELGHPLISKEKRVRNSIDFSQKQFVILTGSNMSGKSTFLRTVGINLVLSYVGAPIDAKKACVYPLPLWVSMRLTDSLSDSESFFFAEVKRLKQIVTEAEKQPIFVLLDEILKGTNSDDKKTGTVGVIEKLHQLNAIGMIATHDLEVCATTEKHNETMINKRFEVEIIDNELHFDYLLKDGICQNKNATFIMKKMEII